MVEAPTGAHGADDFCEECGYQPELKRTLGSFQVFAISFAFISVAVGIFGTYDDVLQNSGPVGIWLWAIAAVGQVLGALVIAQFAARIPLSGSSYQWASRLANPKIGWGFGWLTFCYLVVGVVAVDNALASDAVMPLFGMGANEHVARLITLAVLLIQAVLAIASTRIVAMINSENAPNYFDVGGGLMLAMIMGLATLVGFDAAANLAEEAKNPFRSVPRAIVGSVVAAGLLGMVFLIALTVAIRDIPKVSASGSPVADIMRDQLGAVVERTLLVAITFAFFGAGMVVLATCSRIVFAMSRDSRFPVHRLMRRVDPRTQTPIPATILIFVIGVILMVVLPGAALLELIAASTILPALIYGATVVLYLSVRRR
jgi:amino acid transporter